MSFLLIIYTKYIFVKKFDMCGIVCAYNDKIEIEGLRSQLLLCQSRFGIVVLIGVVFM